MYPRSVPCKGDRMVQGYRTVGRTHGLVEAERPAAHAIGGHRELGAAHVVHPVGHGAQAVEAEELVVCGAASVSAGGAVGCMNAFHPQGASQPHPGMLARSWIRLSTGGRPQTCLQASMPARLVASKRQAAAATGSNRSARTGSGEGGVVHPQAHGLHLVCLAAHHLHHRDSQSGSVTCVAGLCLLPGALPSGGLCMHLDSAHGAS